jgi:ATP-dependent protease ClpP protease subunit
MQLIDAMHSTNGDITVVVTGMAGSAAGMVALHAPSLVITPSSQFLAHNASTGTGGKLGEVVSSVEFSKKYIDKLIKDTYSGFMTEEEIKDMQKGVDFYFDSDEIIQRLEARAKYQEAQQKKIQDDITKVEKQVTKIKAKAK